MTYNPDIHHRHSIRLQGYDYTQAGIYFVTICTHNRECLFGEIVDGEMRLNEMGRIVADEWINTANIRNVRARRDEDKSVAPSIDLDEWVVMPNHFHGIILLSDNNANCMGTARRAFTGERFGKPVTGSFPTIIRSFKSAVTKRINELRNTPGVPLWQRNYWEHIVRNESELDRIREYIQNNPAQWEMDRLNPAQSDIYFDRNNVRDTANRALRESIAQYGAVVRQNDKTGWMT